MVKPRNAPKYWDDSQQRVVEGVEIRETPTKLGDILGTYVWVFSGDPEWGGDVEDMWRSGYKDEADFIARHSIVLAAAKHRPGRPVAPEDVGGYITWGTLKVAFDGVRVVRSGRSSGAAVVESYWEVLLTEDQDDSESETWLDKEGNAVSAAVVLDDNGFPFLVFDWHHPPGCHSSWSGYYVGKRLVKGKKWQLTGEEEERLGIGASFRSVEQLVKEGTPGEYEEDFEEEEYFRRDGADESSGEEAVGEERKASADEKDTKKRKSSTDERAPKKGKSSADERGTKRRKSSTDETGAKKRRKRSRRRAGK
ncbi:hypothetical protein F5887DRAFT_1015763 [Amanita rubescens]|nr:hypothetical protein F5887DRAFT_1018664 [Amanita rubescens]KAF8326177.1 hypothetical protein F5887DRAFT_1015763 [Amanita rubescens]